MAYFDNAATTYPKPSVVYNFMDEFYRNYGVNVGRGNYSFGHEAKLLTSETRQLITGILNCPNKQVVFTPTATIALNIIIQGLIKVGVKNVYISPFEHNAVTRILYQYERSGDIRVHMLSVSPELKFDLDRIKCQFDDNRPDMVVLSHASNVVGLVAPIEDIFYLAKKYNSFTVADMAQTAGLIDCNVGLSTFDFAVFAGHKTLYGPTGISGFVMNPEIKIPTILFGGTGVESARQDAPETLPERFEIGTLNISGIAGLNAALKWIMSIGTKSMAKKEKENRNKLLSILKRYSWIKIIGNTNNNFVGIVSCLIDGISSDSAGMLFSTHGIAVRTGLHCAPLAHKFFKTFPAGTIRFSTSYFTSEGDYNELENVLDYIGGELT